MRIEIAKLCLNADPASLAMHIRKFSIQDEEMRIEIAKLCLNANPASLAMHIRKFNIQDEGMRIEIAKLCAQTSGRATAEHIDNFKIQDPNQRVEIFHLCAQQDRHATAECLPMTLEGRCNLDAEHQEQWRALFALRSTTASVHSASERGALKALFSLEGHPLRTEAALDIQSWLRQQPVRPNSQKLNELIDRPLPEDAYKRNLAEAQLILAYVVLSGRPSISGELGGLLDHILNQRHEVAWSLAYSLATLTPDQALRFDQAIRNPSPQGAVVQNTQLPLLGVCAWSSSDQELQPIQAFVHKNNRTFKNASSGLLRTWVNTIHKLDQTSLSPQRKLALLTQACAAPHPVAFLHAIQLLCLMDDASFLDQDFGADIQDQFSKEIHLLMTTRSQVPLGDITDLEQRYLATWGSLRIPNIWMNYESKISRLENPQATQEFSTMIRSVLLGTFRDERYRTDNNPHLQKIQETDPELFEKWKAEQKPQPLASSKKGEVLVDSDDWQDLFLCTTEVGGSCLSLTSSENKNRALLAYVMDGKNRVLAVKDAQGKIVTRALVRVLFHEGKPVLFLDQIVPASPHEHTVALTELARKRAIEIGCPLLTANDFPPDSTPLHTPATSLSSRAPYEHVDAAGGPIEGGAFTIRSVHQVPLNK
jgi:hypothetical protein